ncbi:MAG: DUF937 domain-containing protein [Hyphomicrobium sp.]
MRERPTGVLIQDRLSRAQGGQAFANLARAFHLPPAKVEAAVGAMATSLIPQIEAKIRSRRFLARLIELFSKGMHHQVLENPTMLGTTSTQVLGNDALNVIAGREVAKTIARDAAARSGVSEMIAEYLLPVVAAMVVGALAEQSREDLERLARGDSGASTMAAADGAAAPVVRSLPQVAASGGGFTGSTVGGVGLASPGAVSERLVVLADNIRDGVPLPDGRDAADATRRVLAPYLALPRAPLDWIARLRALGGSAFKAPRTRKRQ